MTIKNLISAALLSVCILMGITSAEHAPGAPTLRTVFTDEFFKNTQKNFIPKFCEHIEEKFTDMFIMKNNEYWVPNLVAIVISLEHLDLRHACVSVIDKQIVTLHEDG